MARIGSARATAVFDDVSKMGGGYATCRDAYSTCMDQLCAKANETYRRCFCSSKFTEFNDIETALDEAKNLLMRFEDNNLNAVDKTAAEVSAMYTATIGEAAIKNDTSAAQKTLDEIGDLLSGKKKSTSKNEVTSLSGITLDFGNDLDDIWGGNGGNDIFASNSTGQDFSKLEGLRLYDAANKQCTEMARAECGSDSIFNMVKSSYNILITQDCNLYEKKINTQKEAVSKTVREAEKILRSARLDEYRAHNSADVNECVTAVKSALTGPNACGENYKLCLDMGTGLYIDTATGDARYTPRLFELPGILNLSGTGDNLSANPNYNKYMDSKRIFAEGALDTCRDKANIVWEEFKRSAIIEIAQAQDAKIEQVKDGCVTVMAECYDHQSKQMKTALATDVAAKATGALNAYAARQMCAEKVSACAALYAGPNDVRCNFDNNGKLTNAGQCGMKALLTLVDTVDRYKVSAGCEVALREFVENECKPASGDTKHKSPYGCRLWLREPVSDVEGDDVETRLQNFVLRNCADPNKTVNNNSYTYGSFKTDQPEVAEMVNTTIRQILEDIDYVLSNECEEAQGVWKERSDVDATDKPEIAFYTSVYAGITPRIDSGTAAAADSNGEYVKANDGSSWGYCVQNTVMYQCKLQDENTGGMGYATFNAARNTCDFSQEWYKIKCEQIGGYFEEGVCYV
jgi:hypothetical protein